MTQAMLLVGESYADQNLYYKTHFLAGDPFVYLENGSSSLLVTSSMEQGRAQKESTAPEVRNLEDFGYRDLVKELGDRSRAFTAVLARIVKGVQADSVLVEAAFPALYADELRAEGIHVEINSRLLVRERRQKSEAEIEAIEEAQRATERATARAIEILAASEEHHGVLHYSGIPLTSERLRTEIEIALIRDGMDASMSPIVAGGPRAADPHWEGAGLLRAGESIVLDVFPRNKRTRYFADMTRTVVKGDPGDTLRRMYSAVLQAQEGALKMIRAGVNARQVHESVEAVFREEGFAGETGPRYIHGTGHGVGLDIHERPVLGAMEEDLLPGDVVTVEPGLYDPEIGAVRIEDLVVVTENGCRNLTRFPKRFELDTP